ncbi:hypothetical protein R6U76_02485 [Lysinibacillus capsici]|uniref:hypothetical protein n=1 Tax=Lysinibacillus TaxID=400634 RepID=UPI001111D7C9|nr:MULTISPECIES: hypothetical protein [Lysinibacillus]MED3875925.1 hypothetical protein [Lysinibacillus capsici]WPK05938.1 hypothetical protein R6U76_02485 [Lysinibacillus capsici]
MKGTVLKGLIGEELPLRGFSGSSDATWTLEEQISIPRLARMSLSADDIVFSTSTSFNNFYLGKLNDR